MTEPTLTYIYQYVGSGLVLLWCLWLGAKAGTLNRAWALLLGGIFLAYALGHAFFQFIAPAT